VVAALGPHTSSLHYFKLSIERPGLALGGIGRKLKEWQNGLILSEVLKSVDFFH
jgi:hypothetical protein